MRRIGPVLGAAALCLAVSLLAIGADVPASLDRSIVVTASGMAAVGLGVLVWHQHRSDATSRDTPSTERFPDRTDSGGTRTRDVVGDQIDRVVRAESDAVRASRRRIRNDLRLAVETALVRRLDLSPAEATTRVSEGTWTDDPRAASLLGDAEHRSRSIRFRDWLVDKRHYRCVRATLRELEAIGQSAPSRGPRIQDGSSAEPADDLDATVSRREAGR